MENGPFIDGLPIIRMVDLSMAMLVITRGYKPTVLSWGSHLSDQGQDDVHPSHLFDCGLSHI